MPADGDAGEDEAFVAGIGRAAGQEGEADAIEDELEHEGEEMDEDRPGDGGVAGGGMQERVGGQTGVGLLLLGIRDDDLVEAWTNWQRTLWPPPR
ncbi:MAG: hypothetical protein M5U12_31640 [Verrucomicrobia bacterium]|nr:hypothetical protein [Verrucomicrobiota bacterium]